LEKKMIRKLSYILTLILLVGLTQLSFATVMINEILYDTVSRDDSTLMFTELWGDPGTNVGGYTLVGINGNGGTEYRTVTIPDGTVIPADGYLVIGNRAQVPNVDVNLNCNSDAGIDWQNAGSSGNDDCDGIDLRDSDGNTIDHICYGPCAAGHTCTGEGGTNAPDPFPAAGVNKSLARVPDHTDTDNNGTDWVIADVPTPGAPNSAPTPCDTTHATLGQIRQNDGQGSPTLNNSFVDVRGIVNVANFVLDSASLTSFYIQDDEAGCNVFRGVAPANLVEGDCVRVDGWVGTYYGLTEIKSTGTGTCVAHISYLSHVTPPAPTIIHGNSDFESLEGMLVRIDNVTIVDGTWPGAHGWANINVTDGSGTILMRIVQWTNIGGTTQPVGPFSVIGILTQHATSSTPPFTGGYQITPRYATDIIAGNAVDDPNAAEIPGDFRLVNVYPNPFNSVAQINYEVGSTRDLTLSIYDLLGRQVAVETMRNVAPGMHTYSWTPSVSTGLYFVRLASESKVETSKLLYLK
jgi:hypothetical protein